MIMIAGVGSAEELNVDFVSQYNTYNNPVITNALTTEAQDLSSHYGGSVSNVAVAGNYAYLGQGQDMLVVDISEVSSPSEAGRLTTPSLVNNVVVSGNYAYVANGENGLVIVDITDPASPVIEGTYDSGSAYGVAVSENYAYVADGANGLVIIDITDPAAPTLKGFYNTAGDASGIAIAENYAYVADGVNGLVVVDIADPSSPNFKGTYNTAGDASDVAVSGYYAYVADDTSGLAIINITDPSSPTLADTYDTNNHALGVAVSGSYAYVSDGDGGGLVIVNISNPTAVSSVAVYSATAGNACDVAVSGNYAYVAYGRSGFTIVNVTNPAAPAFAGKYDMSGYASGVAIYGNYACVANGYMGLSVINIADKSSPTSAGRYITAGYARDVAVSGKYAYVANGNNGLVIVDIITNPAAPAYKSNYDTSGHSWGVTVSGNYAYVADGAGGLVIVDIANSAVPTFKGNYDTAGNAETVVIADNYAYVADGDNGLVIVDITNPAAPTLKGSYNTAGHAYGITVINQYAYIADGSDGLVILDVTNPAAPTLKGNYDTNFAQSIAVSGNYAYIADDSNGLVITNITIPAAPTLAGSYNTAGHGYGVAISGSYVYVADFNNGLVILHVDTVPDTTAPASVTGLNEVNVGLSWINWTWTNPTNDDFNYATVYIDGVFVTNTSTGYYNSTGLAEETTHTISTRTVDTAGNINSTWVNDSASTISLTDIVPPASVTNLGETDVGSDRINWTWTNPADSDFSHVIVYLNGTFITNTSDSSINFYNATGLSKGATYTIGIRTVDTSENINSVCVNDSATTLKLPEVSGLSGTNITKTSITLTWENSDDTSRVQISRNDVVLANVSGSTSYADSNLTSSTTYRYTLVPYNNNGLEGEAVSISLKTKSVSSTGGSTGGSTGSSSKKTGSSGGSGAAASVEDFANMATKDVAKAYLRMDANATYQFAREGNPILSISFYSLKNSGETVSTVEVLNNRSKLVNSTPEGVIYHYVNMWVGKAGFATPSNIKDAQVKFKVNTSWMQQTGVNPVDIKLQRYNGTAWEVLPTEIVSNTTDYVVFKSQTSGFSPFTITAEKPLPAALNSDVHAGNEVTGSVSELTSTEDTREEQAQPEKSNMWIFGIVILVTGIAAVGYVYLNKKQN
jgi:PGF-pre-PGF domain-containing protein